MKLLKILFAFSCLQALAEPTPSTVITSNSLKMLRKTDHNEFSFKGQVRLTSKNLFGECQSLWVYALHLQKYTKPKKIRPFYGLKYAFNFKPYTYMHIIFKQKTLQESQLSQNQIQEIIAKGDVFLETTDVQTQEKKQAHSDTAYIYPQEGKMVLMGHARVSSSLQGSFQGEQITFFRDSEQIIIETPNNQRSQAVLSESF